jgi:F420-0:gamma-glutamyl ligase
MIVAALKSPLITPSAYTVLGWLDQILPEKIEEGSVVALTSKVVALCEGSVVPTASTTKAELARAQADRYVDTPENEYDVTFTVIRNTLIANAGVDESNVKDAFVLWPKDPQTTAAKVRVYLKERYKLRDVGVVITDSVARPLRWGVGGIAIGFSGFKALKDYRGTPDLYGRTFLYETTDMPGGLAAAATLVMGEGTECTPAAVLSDVPFVDFQEQSPTPAELESVKISVENDLYAPMFRHVPWKTGGQGQSIQSGGALQ